MSNSVYFCHLINDGGSARYCIFPLQIEGCKISVPTKLRGHMVSNLSC